MKKVLVETIYMFKHSYLCEIPDESPSEWALDTVTMEEAEEFTQEGLGETILGYRVVTDEEACDYYNKINYDERRELCHRIENCDRFVTPWRGDDDA